MSLIIEAIKQKRYKKIQVALQLGWNLNQRSPNQLSTPLIELTFIEREAIAARLCKRFLFAGARMDLKDKSGRNALHWACFKGREKLVDLFLSDANEIDLNVQDYEGNTALSLAVMSNNENIVRKLIKALNRYHLSVDVPNTDGETPLILASKARSYLLCDILIKIGRASTEIRDKKRQLTAKEWEDAADDSEELFDFKNTSKTRQEEKKLLQGNNSKRPRAEENYYKSEMFKIFRLYCDELSSSFRPPAIQPAKEESNLPTYEYESDSSGYLLTTSFSTCPVPPTRCRKRFTKVAQVPLSVTRMRMSKNTATEKSQNTWLGKQENCRVNRKRSIIPKLEAKVVVPVVKRSSCPILRRRTLHNKDEMDALRLEVLNEDIEQE